MPAASASSPWRIELRETLRLAVPLAMANMLQMAVYAIDVIFVARLGQSELAASSLAIALFGLMMWCFSALTGAVAPLIAAELGRGRHAVREVRRSVRMALWLTVVCSLVGMAIASHGEAILLATGQDAHIADRAGSFLSVLMWAIGPMIASNVLRTFASALGRPVVATAITALSIAVNALGNWVFVFGNLGMPALGLEGSALSSVLTAVVALAAYVVAIRMDRKLARYRVFGRWWRPEWARLRQIMRIGAPIAATVLAEGGLFSSAAFLMGLIDPVQLAAHTVALQVAAFAFQVPFGVGQATTIRVGWFFGAGDRAGMARAGWTGMAVGLSFVMLAAAAMLAVPQLILSIYIDVAAPANAALVGYAVQFLAIAAAFQLFDGTQAVAAGALRGLQDTKVPMAMAIFGYWLPGFGTAALLGLGTPLQGFGVWIGLAIGLVVVSVLLLWRWTGRDRLLDNPA